MYTVTAGIGSYTVWHIHVQHLLYAQLCTRQCTNGKPMPHVRYCSSAASYSNVRSTTGQAFIIIIGCSHGACSDCHMPLKHLLVSYLHRSSSTIDFRPVDRETKDFCL
jgi:hypothetical protein